jgi:hypothetical protein
MSAKFDLWLSSIVIFPVLSCCLSWLTRSISITGAKHFYVGWSLNASFDGFIQDNLTRSLVETEIYLTEDDRVRSIGLRLIIT